MDYLRAVRERLPSTEQLPTLKSLQNISLRDASKDLPQRLAFFRKRIRIRGNSKFSVPLYLVLLFPLLVIIIISLLFIRHPNSPGGRLIPAGAPPSIRKINEKHDKVFVTGCLDPKVQQDAPRANAVFVVLARNKELDGVIESLKSVERHFNRWFHYPYVFLNDGDFNSTFKETILNYTSSPVEFGKIPAEHWGYPDWVDTNVAKEAIRKQGDAAIMYGGMESYHHMCRFYSGFFYKHELLQKYDWYWRVEPEIKYFCDITYDPFVHMARANKTYGFTIAVKELKETVPNIFRYASAFKRTHNLTSQGLWEMFVEPKEGFNQDGSPKKDALNPENLPKDDPKYAAEKQKPMPEDILRGQPGAGTLPDIDPEAMDGDVYNMCHYWSNFEIAKLDFFRSQEYEDFFNMMDRSGGFWTERWGDAPIHSLAAGALLAPSDIHYFRDFGYRHTTIQHCPANAPARQLPREPYLERTTVDEKARREEDEYWAKWDTEKENGVGCRCRCDTDVVDVEGKEGSCIPEWVEIAGGFVTPAGRD
ncbi:O-glycoside alpha-1,2-mannosyltransferase 4 [Friedmanniomyces endolithicus]|uniref:O-glycoside alpha-1,2-mannosyltransferase 4 n=1 Tax=Friedmanniomyces endolithicus TaxID=329885 RepID=A0AAN6FAM7_9PEZI|nr:O-glycoside alpha-1,2-mannosyltransferase 4 [Friedmanniomyces endolithicus]KAK0293004.1 O-glycoside alpha-1,2-mannosyltransferase 4 [Friedmanniomyces endolithicus]KAK0310214.1 O-glycoside alpha-1,2-mannosyltransferase 4 [Friedmanniomyces endolithicus]KAK1017766.1 O-glycoside alpha-1,2-mannosyltransferase 4 [Friedmanniomyces endolithicus]